MQSKPNRAEKLETIRRTFEHMYDHELDVFFGELLLPEGRSFLV